MHSHPNLDETALHQIGIWEDDGKIVGVAHYESHLGEAFFEIHPDYTGLKSEMLIYAENHLDLTIVIESPDGEFVAFSGAWYDKTNQICYVEPVATDPDYRRLGLGRAAVMEGIRRCQALGATTAYVGSDQPFYHALGFKTIYNTNCWQKNQD